MGFRRWWSRLAGTPARVLMRIVSRRVPHQEYDGIRLVVADFWLEPSAERFFDRTREALARAASGAPRAYSELRKDIQQVAFWGQTEAPPYQRFQLAAVVPQRVALEADTACYAAWLLYTSAYLHGEDEAHARSEEFLRSLEPDERTHVTEWLASIREHGPQ
jgi:hypothetical protein